LLRLIASQSSTAAPAFSSLHLALRARGNAARASVTVTWVDVSFSPNKNTTLLGGIFICERLPKRSRIRGKLPKSNVPVLFDKLEFTQKSLF
jgi:hypothetical protein